MRRATLFAALLAAAACRGTVPNQDAPPEQSISAILVAARVVLPGGETRDASMAINFETDGGSRAEVYRLPLRAGENALFLVEPGAYRLAPTRSWLGFYDQTLTLAAGDRVFRVPFPRELLRLDPFRVKPSKIATLGVLTARVLPAPPGRDPEVRLTFDDGVAARRQLVQDMIRTMMDPSRPLETRESAISWSRALQASLMDILSEEDKRPLYTPAP